MSVGPAGGEVRPQYLQCAAAVRTECRFELLGKRLQEGRERRKAGTDDGQVSFQSAEDCCDAGVLCEMGDHESLLRVVVKTGK